MNYKGILLPSVLLAMGLMLTGCEGDESPQAEEKALVGVVDVQKIMQQSVPAKAAAQHLQEARAVLQKGLKDLEEKWKDAPENEKRRVLTEGVVTLNRQMAREDAAAKQIVGQIMQEECAKLRAEQKLTFVVARQTLIDADSQTDITDNVLKAMETRVAQFPPLPKVDVKDRPAPEPKAEEKKAPAKQEEKNQQSNTKRSRR